MKHRLTTEQRIAILAAYAIDRSTQRVASLVGSSAMTVWRFLRSQGVVIVKEGTRRKGISSRPKSLSKAAGAKKAAITRHARCVGNKRIDARGYVVVNVGPNNTKREHVIVAECALGRPFKKGELAHHVDEVRHHNENTNLVICTTGYHLQLHARMRKLWGKNNPFRKEP